MLKTVKLTSAVLMQDRMNESFGTNNKNSNQMMSLVGSAVKLSTVLVQDPTCCCDGFVKTLPQLHVILRCVCEAKVVQHFVATMVSALCVSGLALQGVPWVCQLKMNTECKCLPRSQKRLATAVLMSEYSSLKLLYPTAIAGLNKYHCGTAHTTYIICS